MQFKGSILSAVIIMMCSASLEAAAINYGNFGPVPPGVSFLQVTESSGTDPTPLYNSPTPFTTGLNFTPTSFVSSSSGGNIDVTDGQLNFTVAASPGVNLDGLSLAEAGDYTLIGTGTPQTSVFAGAILRIQVTQVNGVNVVPFDLPTANASVGFNLTANAGIVQPWSLGLSDPVNDLPAGQHATAVNVSINNSLDSLSEASSLAFIAKKNFMLTVQTDVVPEPGTCMLVLLGAPLMLRRRRAD